MPEEPWRSRTSRRRAAAGWAACGSRRRGRACSSRWRCARASAPSGCRRYVVAAEAVAEVVGALGLDGGGEGAERRPRRGPQGRRRPRGGGDGDVTLGMGLNVSQGAGSCRSGPSSRDVARARARRAADRAELLVELLPPSSAATTPGARPRRSAEAAAVAREVGRDGRTLRGLPLNGIWKVPGADRERDPLAVHGRDDVRLPRVVRKMQLLRTETSAGQGRSCRSSARSSGARRRGSVAATTGRRCRRRPVRRRSSRPRGAAADRAGASASRGRDDRTRPARGGRPPSPPAQLVADRRRVEAPVPIRAEERRREGEARERPVDQERASEVSDSRGSRGGASRTDSRSHAARRRISRHGPLGRSTGIRRSCGAASRGPCPQAQLRPQYRSIVWRDVVCAGSLDGILD